MLRRTFICGGGGFLAALPFIGNSVAADSGPALITMSGRPDGSRVWFDPIGILIRPGQTVRWTNKDKSNSHTATAYHPDNFDHALRIPKAAEPFDSDYLLPDESYEVTLTAPGVYDYFCAPHEAAGMVGRIVVTDSGSVDFSGYPPDDLPQAALDRFPSVADILARGAVRAPEVE